MVPAVAMAVGTVKSAWVTYLRSVDLRGPPWTSVDQVKAEASDTRESGPGTRPPRVRGIR